jgi:puromycin-sensitive aminopeptidase
VAATGDADTYERLRTGFLEGTTPQSQLRHLYALAEFDDESLVLRTCEFVMTPAVKTQNAPFVLRAAIANRRHGPAAWAFVRDHWSETNERFPANTIIRMIDAVKYLDSADLVADAAAFFEDHPVADQRLGQILERQRINARLRERASRSFDEHLVARDR